MPSPHDVIHHMLLKDAFTRLLGIVVDDIREGFCKLHFAVTPEMLNGFEVLHGGVTYAAADSALAFASNGYNRLSLALSTSMDYFESGKLHDLITVEATEESLRNKTAVYLVRVTNQHGNAIALFKGTVYRTEKKLID